MQKGNSSGINEKLLTRIIRLSPLLCHVTHSNYVPSALICHLFILKGHCFQTLANFFSRSLFLNVPKSSRDQRRGSMNAPYYSSRAISGSPMHRVSHRFRPERPGRGRPAHTRAKFSTSSKPMPSQRASGGSLQRGGVPFPSAGATGAERPKLISRCLPAVALCHNMAALRPKPLRSHFRRHLHGTRDIGVRSRGAFLTTPGRGWPGRVCVCPLRSHYRLSPPRFRSRLFPRE